MESEFIVNGTYPPQQQNNIYQLINEMASDLVDMITGPTGPTGAFYSSYTNLSATNLTGIYIQSENITGALIQATSFTGSTLSISNGFRYELSPIVNGVLVSNGLGDASWDFPTIPYTSTPLTTGILSLSNTSPTSIAGFSANVPQSGTYLIQFMTPVRSLTANRSITFFLRVNGIIQLFQSYTLVTGSEDMQVCLQTISPADGGQTLDVSSSISATGTYVLGSSRRMIATRLST